MKLLKPLKQAPLGALNFETLKQAAPPRETFKTFKTTYRYEELTTSRCMEQFP
jgi:hypothetical protein